MPVTSTVTGINPIQMEFSPRRWQVGDLCWTPESDRFIVLTTRVAIYRDDTAEVITEHGNLLRISLDRIQGEKHNTGLVYQFTTDQQAAEDFKAGIFTPYFEIL